MTSTPPRKLSPKARKEAVEAAIRERGWDHAVALDVAAATGWNWRTIYRDREDVLDLLAQEEQEDLPRRRAAFLSDLRHLRKEARDARAYSPAAKLLSMESTVLGLDRVPLPTVEEEDGPVDTSLEAVLSETRKLRKRAMAGDSYVAADRLLEREHAIVESIRQRDEAAAAKDLVDLSEEEKVAMAADLLRGLPDALRAKVLSGLS